MDIKHPTLIKQIIVKEEITRKFRKYFNTMVTLYSNLGNK